MSRTAIGIVGVVGALLLGGCTQDSGPSPTEPPVAPSHRIADSLLPSRVAGYSALGQSPSEGQTTATYASDSQPLDLAVVTFDPSGDFGQIMLDDQQWYGASRCGVLWESDSNASPAPIQATCITVLTDGVMTTVAGGQQSPEALSQLANAIYESLA